MSDFTYESDDISGVKVAFKNLHLQQPMAMTLGLVGSAAFFWGMMVINRRGGISLGAQKVKFGCTPSLVAFSILPGAYVYGRWVEGARKGYDNASSALNRKYSGITSKVFDYE